MLLMLLNEYIKRGTQGNFEGQVENHLNLHLTFEQHGFEMHGSTYFFIFNKYNKCIFSSLRFS